MFRRDMPDHNAPLTRRQFLAIVQADRRAREDGVRGRPETAAPDIMRDVVEMLQERIGNGGPAAGRVGPP